MLESGHGKKKGAVHMDKAMILVIDGCAPEYLTRETAPDIDVYKRQNYLRSVLNHLHIPNIQGFFIFRAE